VPVQATFWLLDAPDSLEAQSHRNTDGSGIGFFDLDGVPVLDKQPEPAFTDAEFTHEAKKAESTAFVAHVRLATAGGRRVVNTHPFAMDGRIMAHNGGFGDIPQLDERLGFYADLVLGDTDSERYFALIIQQTAALGGDVGAGIAAAARWIAANLPVTSLNTVVAAPGELWALRYPDQHALHILERPAGPGSTDAKPGLHVRSVRRGRFRTARWRERLADAGTGRTGACPARSHRRVGGGNNRAARTAGAPERPQSEHRHLSGERDSARLDAT
jgi:predicted glutamine amidotransferase